MTHFMGGRRPLVAMRKSDKILITLFSCAIAVAMLVGVTNYYLRTHLTVEGTETWYRGNETVAEPESIRFAKTPLELLDVTHPHLFFQSIMFFVLCHIFSLSRVSERRKIVLYAAAFASVLSEAGLPWLIRFGSGVFAPFLIVSTAVMSVSILILVAVPLVEMWRKSPFETMLPTPAMRHDRVNPLP